MFLSVVLSFKDCFFSSRRRHTRSLRDWSSDVCSSDLLGTATGSLRHAGAKTGCGGNVRETGWPGAVTELEAVEVSSPLRSRAHPGRKAGATTTGASAGSKHGPPCVTSRRSFCQDTHLDGRASLRYQARDGRAPRLPNLLLSRSLEGPGPRTRLRRSTTHHA